MCEYTLCWLVITASTVGLFGRYELTAGVELPTPTEWPDNTNLSPPIIKTGCK